YSLYQIGVDTTVILTSAGVISLIIGYGSQSIVSDLISGIFLICEDQIRIGERIIVDGLMGDVTRIGLRTTTVARYNQMKVINNSKMVGFTNISRDTASARWEITVPADTDIEKVKSIILNNSEYFMKVSKGRILMGPIFCGVAGIFIDHVGKSHVSLRFLVVCDVLKQKKLRYKCLEASIKLLKENGIEPTAGERLD
nr:mechanosensitive ion channel family protein [Lachnospiraceae bacterium]